MRMVLTFEVDEGDELKLGKAITDYLEAYQGAKLSICGMYFERQQKSESSPDIKSDFYAQDTWKKVKGSKNGNHKRKKTDNDA